MKTLNRLLIANRGEIALRIIRTAADAGIETVAIHPEDDAASLHVLRADRAEVLPGRGARAYLDVDAVVAAAKAAGADAVHPGYGFLSENAGFAEAVEAAGMLFVGPTPRALGLYGDKVAARKLATDLEKAGFRAFVDQPLKRGGKTLHPVRVGPEPDKAAADRLAVRLKARGLPTAVVAND